MELLKFLRDDAWYGQRLVPGKGAVIDYIGRFVDPDLPVDAGRTAPLLECVLVHDGESQVLPCTQQQASLPSRITMTRSSELGLSMTVTRIMLRW